MNLTGKSIGQGGVYLEKENRPRRPREEEEAQESGSLKTKENSTMSNRAEMSSKVRPKKCSLGLEIQKPC